MRRLAAYLTAQHLTCALAFAVLLAAVAGCGTLNERLFGATETPAQEAYQSKTKLVYVQIPIGHYVALSDVDRGIVQAVCHFEDIAYSAGQGAADAALAGGDRLLQVLAALSGGLASLSLEVFGHVVMPEPDELAARGVVLARVGTRSIVEMRTWRKTFAEVKSNEFVTAGRDPTPEEWAQLDARVDALHGEIRARCDGTELPT